MSLLLSVWCQLKDSALPRKFPSRSTPKADGGGGRGKPDPAPRPGYEPTEASLMQEDTHLQMPKYDVDGHGHDLLYPLGRHDGGWFLFLNGGRAVWEPIGCDRGVGSDRWDQ